MKIYTDAPEGATIVQNSFIDRFMPHANGEFVKVYLYLLRCADSGLELSLSSIADIFDHTEKDIRRALAYWEKQKLLRLKLSGDGMITSVTFLTPPAEESAGGVTEAASAPPASPEPPVRTAGSAAEPPAELPDMPDRGRIAALCQQEEIRQIFFVAEQYLQRPLTSAEQGDLIYYYDVLHFSQDLIEYLLEYCITKGSSSRHYMRKVALGWAEAGISSVAEAKKETNLHNKDYYAVLNAFGIRRRGPAAAEQELMARWFGELGFSIDLVLEACRRTVLQTGQVSFEYADGILSKWRENGVASKADIERLDAKHRSEQKKASARPAKSSGNRFNNFSQREYDYSRLERQLLSQAATESTYGTDKHTVQYHHEGLPETADPGSAGARRANGGNL